MSEQSTKELAGHLSRMVNEGAALLAAADRVRRDSAHLSAVSRPTAAAFLSQTAFLRFAAVHADAVAWLRQRAESQGLSMDEQPPAEVAHAG